jgi:hypothetical protein
LDEAIARFVQETGLAQWPFAEGGHVAGTSRNRIALVSGRFAMIDDRMGFQLVPWQPALDKHLGEEVKGRVREWGSNGALNASATWDRGCRLREPEYLHDNPADISRHGHRLLQPAKFDSL